MKPASALLLLSATFCTFAGVPQEEPSYSLTWKPFLGQTLTYETKISIDSGGKTIEITGIATGKVTKIRTNGDYTVETLRTGGKVIVDREAHEAPDDTEPEIAEYTAKGERIDKKEEGEQAQGNMLRAILSPTEFVPPEKPVKKGDKWVRKIKADEAQSLRAAEIEYEVKGLGKIGVYDVVEVEFKYAHRGDPKPAKVTGSFAFDLKDMSLVKSELTSLDAKMGEEGRATIKAEMIRK
ncbi:hypothetical protein [Fimbriimonas ginsengisoli]|uniref:Lipid/polyisoprenoid-binding YceI-like domain-containing protein n=1 Tax=Fimbriimonas ginsengisoli Gsoil 348 TaxID=661478 RepID=A0A068NUS4_FIMGI|nr:hypothetical protein [Fimbriimonas ginsengisoli]AIE87293.1 hypothetical protein OP10G_3925 [Fimbriimonas ginsengisoli Gsoil 348]